MAKGFSVFAASMLSEEIAGEYRRSVASLVEAEKRVLMTQTKLHNWDHQLRESVESRMR